MSFTIRFALNGEPRTFDGDPMTRLLDAIRYEFGSTGTKEGCGEGECGACTVLLDGTPVCSCLVPMLQVDGRTVGTIENLARDGRLAPIQRACVEAGGVQCGACTPGILVTAQALLDRSGTVTRADVRRALAGNLCRCTGYERILAAIEMVVADR